MPRIATYQPDQQLTEVTRQPRADASAANAVFQSNIQTTRSLAGVAEAAANMKNRIDTTSAEEALVQFERDKNNLFFNPEAGYFNSKGRDAYDGAGVAGKALVDLKEKYGEKLNGNARLMFDRAADNHITKAQVDISRHASTGLKAWEVATSEARVENSIENASTYWNQPEELRVQNALGRQAVIDVAEREGVGTEVLNERLQTFESSFSKAAVTAALNSSSSDAEKLLDKMSDRLEGPDKVKIEKAIEAKKKAEKIQSDSQQAIINGGRFVEQYEDRESIRNEVNKIEDPELRKKVMTESMRQFELKKKAESEARSKSFEDAESHVLNGGSAETFKAEDPEGWARLSAKQKRSIESGESVVTDWNAYYDVILMDDPDLAKIDPSKYLHKLAPAQRNKLASAIKVAKGKSSSKEKIDHQVGRTRNSQMTSVIQQILGKKSKWNKDDLMKADVFYSLVDEELTFREGQEGRLLSSEEFTKLLSDMTRKVIIKRSFLSFDILARDEELSVTDMPPEDIRVLSKHLRDNGITVTADNLMEAQRQASQ